MLGYYIAIMDFADGIAFPFVAYGSNFYKKFKQMAEEKGEAKIVAEVFDVPREVLERMRESNLLKMLVKRIERKEHFDVQQELDAALAKR